MPLVARTRVGVVFSAHAGQILHNYPCNVRVLRASGLCVNAVFKRKGVRVF